MSLCARCQCINGPLNNVSYYTNLINVQAVGYNGVFTVLVQSFSNNRLIRR